LAGLDPVPVLQIDRQTGRIRLPEADLRMASLIRQTPRPVIAHQHLQPNANTLAFLEESGMQPVIMWRDLADSMVSLCEEWERQWTRGFDQVIADGHSVQFLGAVPRTIVERFLLADRKGRYEITIDMALPWYCQFISGWRAWHGRADTSSMLVTYEELCADETGTVAKLLKSLDIPVTAGLEGFLADLKQDKDRANLNVGRAGRGRENLSWRQRKKIARLSNQLGTKDDALGTPPVSADAELQAAYSRQRAARRLGSDKVREKLSLLAFADAIVRASLSRNAGQRAVVLAAEIGIELAMLRFADGDLRLGHHTLCLALQDCARAAAADAAQLMPLRELARQLASRTLPGLGSRGPDFHEAVAAALGELRRLDLLPAPKTP